MTGPIHIHALPFNDYHCSEFLEAIKNALRTMTQVQLHQVHLFNEELEAIYISYNGQWEPFIGFTAGLNPEEDRVYLPEKIWLLDRIGEFLDELNLGIPGGRVMINSTGVLKRFDDNAIQFLCVFTWDGCDFWGTIWNFYNQLLH